MLSEADASAGIREADAGLFSARRGTYWILHRVNDAAHEVVVARIEHRGQVYRRR